MIARSAFLALLAVACAPGARASAPPVNAAPKVVAVPTPPVAPESAQGLVGIEPYAPSPKAVSIVEPREGEAVAPADARARRIVIDDGGYLDENPACRVTLVMDGVAVRDVTDIRAPVTLGGVNPDARDPAVGEHVLAAVLAGPRGEAARIGPNRTVSAAVRRFFVGAPTPRAQSAPSPMLVLLVPRGTYNGPVQAKTALLDFAILDGGDVGAGGSSVSVRVTGGRGTSSSILGGPGPYALRGLESGDYRFDLELRNGAGPLPGALARTSRTITVNLDGPAR